jgi:hypothetical protein
VFVELELANPLLSSVSVFCLLPTPTTKNNDFASCCRSSVVVVKFRELHFISSLSSQYVDDRRKGATITDTK